MNFTDLHSIEGIQFMPVRKDKRPIVVGWQKCSDKHDLSNCVGVGIVCGALSGNIEVIDIDLKYDITGRLFDRYKQSIASVNKELLSKLVVQKTKSGGYHFIYRCSKIEGNLKLARRYATDEEKKLHPDEKIKVLLETRGEGGYIMCFPSSGYELIFRDYYGITEITPDERDTLITIARQFNEVTDEFRPIRYENKRQVKGQTPFEDYNDRGDVIGLLEGHGWKIVGQKGMKTIFLRPGQTTSASSGNYDHDKKWFSVFTTSSEFEPEKAYKPYAVFAVLECKKDFPATAKRLRELGYGDPIEVERQNNQKVPSRISLVDDDFSFIAKEADYEEYLNQARNGTLPKGITTGFKSLDKHFLLKQGNLVMINGHDNVGKSVFIWHMALVSAMLHGWKWIIYSSENSLGSIMRRMIEFYWGRKLINLNDEEFNIAHAFVKKHFAIIKSEDELFNYKDIVNMSKKLLTKQFYNSILLDPYNSLKIELTNSSRLSTHEYHYEALSEIKLFTKKEGVGMFVNNHVISSALRLGAGEKYPTAPQKADTEGGGKFSNKADDFLTLHRILQHPDEWMITEVHVRKIKETETGGHVTPKDEPVKIKMAAGNCSFTDLDGNNPIETWRSGNSQKQKEISTGWKPFKDEEDNESLPF